MTDLIIPVRDVSEPGGCERRLRFYEQACRQGLSHHESMVRVSTVHGGGTRIASQAHTSAPQYSWLKNQVKGDDLAVWQGREQNGDSLFIRPHAQVTRMGMKADEHRDAFGTQVHQQGDGNVFIWV
ncbi:autotransporter outer membrane beta-barrel domain-containing protein [Salmonella enterica subsp. diarizonae]|nr:autotransporter outer membrane beta-barrel domain-containing protein [Salmonella enterica subsp. diarizonae]